MKALKVPTMRELEKAARAVEGLDVIVCLEKERAYVEWRIEAVLVTHGDRDGQRVGPSRFTVRFPFWRRWRASYEAARYLAGRHIEALKEMKEVGL